MITRVPFPPPGFDDLSVDEKIEYLELLWNRIAALREQADDIPLLVEYFIDRYSRKAGKTIRRVNKRTPDHLRSYPWPGNVRELQT